jgi:hypothetical protein
MKDFNRIRNVLDPKELGQGSQVVQAWKGGRAKMPTWATDDQAIQTILLSAFPNLSGDVIQRAKAARWARIIHLYYRSRWTDRQVAEEIRETKNRVRSALKNIARVAQGLTADGKTRVSRGQGRPRK